MKIAFLDIQTTRLEADTGFILCACMKLAGAKEPIFTTRIDENPKYRKKLYDDSYPVKRTFEWLNRVSPDFLVHYNGDFFDIPYLNSRLLSIDHKILPPMRTMDHWKTSRYKLRLRSHSLNTLALHLKVKDRKTYYDIDVWQRAAYGSKEDLDKIVYHCQKDVKVLEQCHNKVVPLLRTLRGIS